MPAPHRVVVLALDGVVPFELGIPNRIFGAAADERGRPLYEVLTCSIDGGDVLTSADFTISVRHDAGILETADTVILPPSHMLDLVIAEGTVPQQLVDALNHVRPTARKVAICTGAFVFAAAGLLDGRTVTTHWAEADRLVRMFPAVHVDADVLYIDDGDILTSAGVAAGIDVCLHLVRSDHGSRVANDVARLCVVPPTRQGGQAQYIQRPVPEPSTTGTAPIRAWAIENLDQPLPLTDLADRARMSVRTFTRQFRAETGVSPGRWLTQQRIDLARHLLEATDLPIERIAERAGFGTATSMRQHLRTSIGVSPNAYRRTFQARAAVPGGG